MLVVILVKFDIIVQDNNFLDLIAEVDTLDFAILK